MAKPPKEKVVESTNISSNLLGSLLNGYKEDHYNFTEGRTFKISTGSLILDQYICINSGIHRFTGYTGAGKTSEVLEVMRNGLAVIPKSKGFLCKAEGRLGEEIIKRSGLKFVWSADEWVYGTIFVFECNVMEALCDTLASLCKSMFEQGEVLISAIDSVDGLTLRDDLVKKTDESHKVAGIPALMKKFLAKMSLPISKYGHFCILLSQVSTAIKLDPYSRDLPRLTSGAGGFALGHFSNVVADFLPRYNKDYILENDKLAPDPVKNKILGHWVSVNIKKADKETEHLTIKYPVKHGRVGKSSIWVEYEIAEVLGMFELVKKAGSWYSLDEALIAEAKTKGIELPDKFQGMDAFRDMLEEKPEMCAFLLEKFRGILGSESF